MTFQTPHHSRGRPERIAWLSASLGLLLIAGCKTWRVEQVAPAQFVQQERPNVVRVDRASDSSQVVLYQPTVIGDTLRGLPTELAIRPVMVPLRDIRTISTKRFSLGKTLLLGVAVSGGVVLYELLQGLNQGVQF